MGMCPFDALYHLTCLKMYRVLIDMSRFDKASSIHGLCADLNLDHCPHCKALHIDLQYVDSIEYGGLLPDILTLMKSAQNADGVYQGVTTVKLDVSLQYLTFSQLILVYVSHNLLSRVNGHPASMISQEAYLIGRDNSEPLNFTSICNRDVKYNS